MERKDCPCKKMKCERHGKCEACGTYHINSRRKRPCDCGKEKNHILKKITIIISFLILLQLGRIVFKSFLFLFINRTLLTDVIASSIFMIAAALIGLLICKKVKIDLKIFPEKFTIRYKICTILLLIFMIVTLMIPKEHFIYHVLSLIYGSIITVIFEEILFRGFVYGEINLIGNDLTAYIVSTILFGIWHFGYIDTVLWRSSLFFPNSNIVNIMFWKAITGTIIGILLGFFRYKNKNVYSSMLVHALINTFGS